MMKTMFLAVALVGSVGAHLEAPTSADLSFVAKVSQGGMFEVQAGRLAATRGSTQDVRDFAVAEVHDHTLVGDRLKAISTTEGIAISAEPNAEFSDKMKRLATLSGAAFDEAYLSEMAALHDADGAAFEQELKGGGSLAFRTFGGETHRIVLRHIGAIHGVPAA